MSNSDNKPKKKWKLWQKILLIIGIIVLVLGIAAGAAFLYFRRIFGGNAPTVTIGKAVDEAVVETTGGLRGSISKESVSEITRFDTLLRYPLLKITRHKAMQGGAGVYS